MEESLFIVTKCENKHKHIINLCETHEKAEYSDRFDAYYCPICKEWLEKKCGDDECIFCINRPNKCDDEIIII